MTDTEKEMLMSIIHFQSGIIEMQEELLEVYQKKIMQVRSEKLDVAKKRVDGQGGCQMKPTK